MNKVDEIFIPTNHSSCIRLVRKAMEKIRDQKRRREGLIMNDNLVVVDDFW